MRLAQRSLTLQPGDSFISPKLTLSVGFTMSIALHAATQARRLLTLSVVRSFVGRGPRRGGNSYLRYPCLKNFFHNCLITNDLKATKGLLSPFKLPLAVKLASALASRRSCAYGSDR